MKREITECTVCGCDLFFIVTDEKGMIVSCSGCGFPMDESLKVEKVG